VVLEQILLAALHARVRRHRIGRRSRTRDTEAGAQVAAAEAAARSGVLMVLVVAAGVEAGLLRRVEVAVVAVPVVEVRAPVVVVRGRGRDDAANWRRTCSRGEMLLLLRSLLLLLLLLGSLLLLRSVLLLRGVLLLLLLLRDVLLRGLLLGEATRVRRAVTWLLLLLRLTHELGARVTVLLLLLTLRLLLLLRRLVLLLRLRLLLLTLLLRLLLARVGVTLRARGGDETTGGVHFAKKEEKQI
jgi:hypothetical protein